MLEQPLASYAPSEVENEMSQRRELDGRSVGAAGPKMVIMKASNRRMIARLDFPAVHFLHLSFC